MADGWIKLWEMLQVEVTRYDKSEFRGSDFKTTLFRPEGVDDKPTPSPTYKSLGEVLRDGWEPLSPWEPKHLAGLDQLTFWFRRSFEHLDLPEEEPE